MPAAIVSFVIKDLAKDGPLRHEHFISNVKLEFMKGGEVAVITFTQRIRLNPGSLCSGGFSGVRPGWLRGP